MKLGRIRKSNGQVALSAEFGEWVLDLEAAAEALSVEDPGLKVHFTAPEALAGHPEGVNLLRSLLERAVDEKALLEEKSRDGSGPLYPQAEVWFEIPLPVLGKIIGVEFSCANYVQKFNAHLSRLGLEVPEWERPERPWTYIKFTSSVIGPGAPVVIPKGADQVDAEGEIGIVIGRPGRHIEQRQAGDHILGLTIVTDLSNRALECKPAPDINHRLHTLGKNHDTFTVIGPWIVPWEEVRGSDLEVRLSFRGVKIGQGKNSDLYWGLEELVSFYSSVYALESWDVILTGTAADTGIFHDPPVFLKAGDWVEVEVQGLGSLRNPVVSED